eukprot:PhF_6_TR8515/c0_g1_i1/m.13327
MYASERTTALKDMVRKLSHSVDEANALSQYAASLHSENASLRDCVECLCQGLTTSTTHLELSVRRSLEWAEIQHWELLQQMGSFLRIVAHTTRTSLLKIHSGSTKDYLCESTEHTLEKILSVLTGLHGEALSVAEAVAATPYFSDPTLESLVGDLQDKLMSLGGGTNPRGGVDIPPLRLQQHTPRRGNSPAHTRSVSPPAPPIVVLKDPEHRGQRGYLLGEDIEGWSVVQIIGTNDTIRIPQRFIREEATQYTVNKTPVQKPTPEVNGNSFSRSQTPRSTTPRTATTPRSSTPRTGGGVGGTPSSRPCKAGDFVEITDVLHPNYGDRGYLKRGPSPVDWVVETTTAQYTAHVTQFRILLHVGTSPNTPR